MSYPPDTTNTWYWGGVYCPLRGWMNYTNGAWYLTTHFTLATKNR